MNETCRATWAQLDLCVLEELGVAGAIYYAFHLIEAEDYLYLYPFKTLPEAKEFLRQLGYTKETSDHRILAHRSEELIFMAD